MCILKFYIHWRARNFDHHPPDNALFHLWPVKKLQPSLDGCHKSFVDGRRETFKQQTCKSGIFLKNYFWALSCRSMKPQMYFYQIKICWVMWPRLYWNSIWCTWNPFSTHRALWHEVLSFFEYSILIREDRKRKNATCSQRYSDNLGPSWAVLPQTQISETTMRNSLKHNITATRLFIICCIRGSNSSSGSRHNLTRPPTCWRRNWDSSDQPTRHQWSMIRSYYRA